MTMVLILNGNSEIGTHVKSNLCYLICLRHLIRSRVVTNRNLVFSLKRFFFLHACATWFELPSTVSMTLIWGYEATVPKVVEASEYAILQFYCTLSDTSCRDVYFVYITRRHWPMVLILDGNSEQCTHEGKSVFSVKWISDLRLLSIYANALNRSNNRDCSLRAHLLLS